MIENLLMVTEKVLLLFLLMGVGFLAAKTRMISHRTAEEITDFVFMIVTPCVIISAFQADRGAISLWTLGKLFLFALAIHIIGIVISRFLYRRQPEDQKRVLQFGCIYSNSGFMGIPLVQAVLGDEGVIYASAYLAVFNLLVWTHGVTLMGNDGERISWKKALLTPALSAWRLGCPSSCSLSSCRNRSAPRSI